MDNPFFWQTKTQVIKKIDYLGMAEQIAHTRSCADIHNQTKQHVHCGRCSQCIDRRFAILSADLQKYDPEEAYKVDLITGVRSSVQDKEIALSYVRNALTFEVIEPSQLLEKYLAVLAAVRHLGVDTDTALIRITDLPKRHGTGVAAVMKEIRENGRSNEFPDNSLLAMFGELRQQQAAALFVQLPKVTNEKLTREPFQFRFNRNRQILVINGVIEIKGVTYELLLELAKENLSAAGRGMDLLDYPLILTNHLCSLLDISNEETLRRRIKRARQLLADKLVSAGFDEALDETLVENFPWRGYRLNPVRVRVFMEDGQ